ncbi:esterase E4-like [Pseudomyrmex gracilis]|uniref:esterase E4-like n=1 Tax=Pseudomyrmex gracilis TaxID=219809 RepID=UPI0009957A96|nr:esterase E4-like [Pseudomyrmex gracilis]
MSDDRIAVNVSEGKLIGIIEKEDVYGNKYAAFRGIPYAQPPVGELRFKDPVPPKPWPGDRDASKYGNICIQQDIFTQEFDGDEDCLYLNVYTTDIKPQTKRPVMVWIHGGGFYLGSGDAKLYGPDYIIQKDVVLITLNYRLGVFGFLNLYDKVATGNQGLKDVVMALQWVRKNVSQFGGNPENVTIFGESAGGVIVHCLTISSLAKGLFHKAISQSGVATCPWAFADREPRPAGFQLAEILGKKTSDPKVAYEFLKSIDAKTLRQAELTTFQTENERRKLLFLFVPSLDLESSSPFFAEDLHKLVQRGVKVPFLLGYTSNEGAMFVDRSKQNIEKLNSNFKRAVHPRLLSELPQIPITVEELRFLYFGNKAVSEETLLNYSAFLTDSVMIRNIVQTADIQTKSGSRQTYLYEFAYRSENNPMRMFSNNLPGACHGEELFFLFYPHMIRDMGLSTPTPDSDDYKIIKCMTQMWTDFAKTGNPTPARTNVTPVKWKPLKRGNLCNYLNIDSELRAKIFRKGEQRWDWKSVKNKL